MTYNELIEQARRQLGPVWNELEVNVAACVKQALAQMAYKVMRDDDIRPLLQQDYTITLDSNGEGNLLAAIGTITGDAGEILQGGVKFGVVKDADGNVLKPIEHYNQFIAPQYPQVGYYCLAAQKILTRAINIPVTGPLDIVGAPGPLTIRASFQPFAVEDVPQEIEDLLVQTLCSILAPINADS